MLLGDDLKEEPMGKNKMDRLYERFMASEDLRNKIRDDLKKLYVRKDEVLAHKR